AACTGDPRDSACSRSLSSCRTGYASCAISSALYPAGLRIPGQTIMASSSPVKGSVPYPVTVPRMSGSVRCRTVLLRGWAFSMAGAWSWAFSVFTCTSRRMGGRCRPAPARGRSGFGVVPVDRVTGAVAAGAGVADQLREGATERDRSDGAGLDGRVVRIGGDPPGGRRDQEGARRHSEDAGGDVGGGCRLGLDLLGVGAARGLQAGSGDLQQQGAGCVLRVDRLGGHPVDQEGSVVSLGGQGGDQPVAALLGRAASSRTGRARRAVGLRDIEDRVRDPSARLCLVLGFRVVQRRRLD